MLIMCCSNGNSYHIAQEWHQYIRKVSHLTRWAFRSFHNGWTPERVYPLEFSGRISKSDPEMEDPRGGDRDKLDERDHSTRRINSSGPFIFGASSDPQKVDPSLDTNVLPAEVIFTSIASAPLAPAEEREYYVVETMDMAVVDLESASVPTHGGHLGESEMKK